MSVHESSRRNRLSIAGLVVGVLALASMGCARDDVYAPVNGKVLFKGQEVKEGTIQFCLQDGQQSIVYGGAVIKDGKYAVPKDHGLKPGVYLVRISAPERVTGKESGDAMNPFLTRETVPVKYNAQSSLTVEIRPGGPATLDFNLD